MLFIKFWINLLALNITCSRDKIQSVQLVNSLIALYHKISHGIYYYPYYYIYYRVTKWARKRSELYNTGTNLGPPAHLSIFLPPPGILVRMHRAYLVRLAEVYGHLVGILHSFRARSRFTTMDAQTSFLQLKLQSREVTLDPVNCTASPLLKLIIQSCHRTHFSHSFRSPETFSQTTV